MEEKREISLPENAFRELGPGETYEPIIPADQKIPEVTVRSVLFGSAMAVLFSCAAAYIALKLGQGIETAIPIAILAVGFSAVLKKKSTMLENVNVLAVGATSGIIVGGAVFTLPALYILEIDHLSSFFQLFLVSFFGCVLGVLFLIPFRRYFVTDMHGKLPFPEATATTEILLAGEKGGAQAKVLVYAMILGGIYDYLVIGLRLWRENFTTALISSFDPLTHKVKAVFSLNTSAAIVGLGYIIGVRYAAIILAGSMLSWLVFNPLFAHLGTFMDGPISAGAVPLRDMAADDIFYEYVRFIGIGGIFAAGLMGILKMLPTIGQAITRGFREIVASRRTHADEGARLRTDDDIPMSVVIMLFAVVITLLWVYFRFSVLAGQPNPTTLSLVALTITVVISFLFASVSAWAVAMIGVTPISGMTLMTLIITCVILIKAGLTGEQGMLAALLVGGVLCTALSTTATLVTEFKIGYWIGATPRKIQWSNIVGAIISAVMVSLMIILLSKIKGFAPSAAHPTPLPAPQPNAMAAVIKSLMVSSEAPWHLYGIGAAVAVLIEMLGISSLAFALGMYLPIELNAPILVGAVVAHFVRRSSRNEEISRRRHDRGTLIASGLIAGGALAGVFDAVVKLFEEEVLGRSIIPGPLAERLAHEGPGGNWVGLGVFALLCAFIYWDSRRGVREQA